MLLSGFGSPTRATRSLLQSVTRVSLLMNIIFNKNSPNGYDWTYHCGCQVVLLSLNVRRSALLLICLITGKGGMLGPSRSDQSGRAGLRPEQRVWGDWVCPLTGYSLPRTVTVAVSCLLHAVTLILKLCCFCSGFSWQSSRLALCFCSEVQWLPQHGSRHQYWTGTPKVH